MTDISEEERCVALTEEEERCSRVAKEGEFCFQHDASAETIETRDSEYNGIFNLVADQAAIRPDQLTGVKRDIAQNMEDVLNSVKDAQGALTSLDFDEAMDTFRDAAESTAATPAKYAAVGGTAGSIGGPAGAAAGATVGAWYGVFEIADDDRSIRAQVVKDVTNEVDVIPSDHPEIADVEPIQLAIQSGVDTKETKTEWLRSTVFRDRDMDRVEEALGKIPGHQNERGATEYYIRDQDSGEILRVVFGEPIDE